MSVYCNARGQPCECDPSIVLILGDGVALVVAGDAAVEAAVAKI